MDQKQMTTTDRSRNGADESQARRQPLPTLEPATDIWETAETIWVVAELPGAAQEGIEVVIDRNHLAIRAESAIQVPEGMRPAWREFPERVRYERWFVLPDSVDRATTTATFKDGVLTLALAKAPEAKPRRIAISAG